MPLDEECGSGAGISNPSSRLEGTLYSRYLGKGPRPEETGVPSLAGRLSGTAYVVLRP